MTDLVSVSKELLRFAEASVATDLLCSSNGATGKLEDVKHPPDHERCSAGIDLLIRARAAIEMADVAAPVNKLRAPSPQPRGPRAMRPDA